MPETQKSRGDGIQARWYRLNRSDCKSDPGALPKRKRIFLMSNNSYSTSVPRANQVPCLTYSVKVSLFVTITPWQRFWAGHSNQTLISQPLEPKVCPNPLICGLIEISDNVMFRSEIEEIIPASFARQTYSTRVTEYYILWSDPTNAPHKLKTEAVNLKNGLPIGEMQRLNNISALKFASKKDQWLDACHLTPQAQLDLTLLFKRHSMRNFKRQPKTAK
jgi:hypothetical protein